ncbi:hypothetical protein XA68_12222 [Ophiocordyceps unilateralis]|uniref:Uncharacterized protein n=1 Tax=Ophiocordyceps unilateralis TaxID=268505 RepID=A0A2A9PDP6_OPHUN|nr:hypothetical protein XA68_12222 [Ophiocordyceps unilateralis]
MAEPLKGSPILELIQHQNTGPFPSLNSNNQCQVLCHAILKLARRPINTSLAVYSLHISADRVMPLDKLEGIPPASGKKGSSQFTSKR